MSDYTGLPDEPVSGRDSRQSPAHIALTSADDSAFLAQPDPRARQNALTLVVGFALVILVGTLLLRLPIAGATRSLSWSEAFFTATSATTVTGLVVVSTAADLSSFGQLVVLLLIEVGGVGFVTFSVILFALIGRRLGFANRLLLQQSLGVFQTVRITRVALIVLLITVALQLVGAMLLWLRWWPTLGAGPAAYQALFHAVSAFCNAGFDLFSGTGTIFFGYGHDPYTLTVLMILVSIGGLGIVVVSDLVSYPWDRRLSVHTKLTLLITSGLPVGAFGVLFVDETFIGGAFSGMTTSERAWTALFTAVSARTAGLTIIPLDRLSEAGVLVLLVAMFIGGAPASMAGGVTISTIAVIGVAVSSTVRGKPQAVVFDRVLPFETIAKAMAIMTVGTLLCFAVTLLLLAINPQTIFRTGFEVVSAFSNTGYSLGMTTELTPAGRVLIAFTMFWGRLGPLTLVILLTQRERPVFARYPSERIVIG